MNASKPKRMAAIPRSSSSHQHLASACSIGRPGSEAVMSRAVCMAFSSSVPLVDIRQSPRLSSASPPAARAPQTATPPLHPRALLAIVPPTENSERGRALIKSLLRLGPAVSRNGRLWNASPETKLLRFDTRELDHLGPLL